MSQPTTTDRAPSGIRRLLIVPEHVDKASAIAFARVFIGVFWLFEVTVGHNWKLGGFGSGTNPGWVGPGAGDAVRASIAEAVEDGTWSWVAWLYQNAIEPNAAAFSYLVIVVQLAFGLLFVFGFLVRPTALVALLFDLSVFLLGNSRIPPMFSAAHLFLLYTGAGRYYGADGWIIQTWASARGRFARAVRWLIDLPLLKWSAARYGVLTATALLAAYFFLQIPMRDTTRMGLVAMDLAVLFALVAVGMAMAQRTADRLGLAAALLRVFVGYKLLHEIWVRVEPGVNGLPGWAGVDEQRVLFETISDNHWRPFAWVVDTLVLPVMPLWVVVFGVVQVAVGVLLLVGYRTRVAAMVGLGYLAGLGVLGFTRYAPFLFGLLVVVLALDAGRVLSLESGRLARGGPARYGLPIPRPAIVVLLVLATANAIAAAVAVVSSGGIAPDGYVASMGQMTTAMVAIFCGLFAVIGWLRLASAPHGERAASETPTDSGRPLA